MPAGTLVDTSLHVLNSKVAILVPSETTPPPPNNEVNSILIVIFFFRNQSTLFDCFELLFVVLTLLFG